MVHRIDDQGLKPFLRIDLGQPAHACVGLVDFSVAELSVHVGSPQAGLTGQWCLIVTQSPHDCLVCEANSADRMRTTLTNTEFVGEGLLPNLQRQDP